MSSHLDQSGFAIVQDVLARSRTEELAREIDAHLASAPAAGFRGLAQLVPGVREVARSAELRTLVDTCLSTSARLVRSIFFNKSRETNWQVAWHQDLAIAVQDRVEIDGFVSWSLKEGVPHVQPPKEILDRMLTVRLHLDPADESNGALWVVPGSHRLGRLRAAGVRRRRVTRSAAMVGSSLAGNLEVIVPYASSALTRACAQAETAPRWDRPGPCD